MFRRVFTAVKIIELILLETVSVVCDGGKVVAMLSVDCEGGQVVAILFVDCVTWFGTVLSADWLDTCGQFDWVSACKLKKKYYV